MSDETNPFHLHLDKCQQCRDHPHELCPTGAQLLIDYALVRGTGFMKMMTEKELKSKFPER